MTTDIIVQETFKERFDAEPTLIVRGPGRVNLIGEHTDYNDGFVLPLAINLAVWMAARARDDRRILIHSLDFDQVIEFSLDDLQKGSLGPGEYIKGVAHFLQESGRQLVGFNGVVMGDIPIGAGLSSSAALELATARTFSALSGFDWHPVEMAKLAQQAENQWVGMNCGIMDQLISAAGLAGQALLIDCRSLELRQTPLPSQTVIVVLDTNTRRGEHGLIDSEYSNRREQCEEAAHVMGIPALRDATMEVLNAHRESLSDIVYRRARHVITENERVLKVHEAMHRDDVVTIGQLINETHASLRDDHEVSGPALNAIVEIAQSQAGCYGARMMGGGFAGCAVALVKEDLAEGFMQIVHKQYQEQMSIEPHLYICEASDGASIVKFEA